MSRFSFSHANIQKIFLAIDYCMENRSQVNDVFYFSSLKYIDSSFLESKVIPVEVAERLIETWINCYRGLLEDKHLLGDKAKNHLVRWQELLMLPPAGLH